MYNKFHGDFNNTGVSRDPVMTLKELSNSFDCSYSTIRRRFKESGSHVDVGMTLKGNKYYIKSQLLSWAKKSIGHESVHKSPDWDV